MPTYVAFLRAINLGATRKFPKASIVSATEAAGGTAVQTHINTGNVLVTLPLRSRAKVEAALGAAYEADRGFAVPTMVFTPAEVVAIVEEADRLVAEHGEPDGHYVTLFKDPPTAAAVSALPDHDGERAFVSGRVAHGMLYRSFHQSKLLTSKPFAALGVGTARNLTVIRAIADKWCD
jgi:uncharacterized protein (DUF1697 family)